MIHSIDSFIYLKSSSPPPIHPRHSLHSHHSGHPIAFLNSRHRRHMSSTPGSIPFSCQRTRD